MMVEGFEVTEDRKEWIQVHMRIPPELHHQLRMEAAEKRESLNWVFIKYCCKGICCVDLNTAEVEHSSYNGDD